MLHRTGNSVPLADVDAVSVRFGDRTVVDGLSLTVHAGERWGLVGESGSGKSLTEQTLARVRGREVALMTQDSAAALNPLVPVGVQVALPLRALHGRSRAQARSEVLDRLAAVGFPDPERVTPFLGLGAARDSSEWGAMLADSLAYIQRAPWTIAAPTIGLAVLGLVVGLVRGTGDPH